MKIYNLIHPGILHLLIFRVYSDTEEPAELFRQFHVQYFYGSHTYEKRKNATAVQPVQQKLFSNRKLAALLIPLALDQLLNSFMGTVDTLVVSNLGSAAISAVSLVDSINILIVQAFLPWPQEEL